jgi:hypothetical protein
MVSPLNNCTNIFRPLFCHILLKSALSGHIFGASFELFGRKFGHLATVWNTFISDILGGTGNYYNMVFP